MKTARTCSFIYIIFVAGCITAAPNNYKAETTKGVDYKKYKKFAWLATSDTAFTKLASRKQVENALSSAVIQQLNAHGMTLDTANPDCYFSYTLVLNKTYEYGQAPPPVYAPSSNVGALPGQYEMYYYVPASTAYYNPALYQGSMKVTTFRDGTLVIDMIDAKSRQIIWRSSAEGKVQEKDRQGIRPTINQVVPPMFKKFPV